MKIINIFTDGSSFIKKDYYESSSGCIIDSESIRYLLGSYHKDGTISYGELYGIRLALNAIYYTFGETLNDYKINIFSDSEYCVKSLTEWIKNWSKFGRDCIWIKSDGKKVMYQDIMKYIYYDYIKRYDINIYHINSHVGTKISENKASIKFLKKYPNFNDGDFKLFSKENTNVDLLADKIRSNKIKYYADCVNKKNGCSIILNKNIF